MKTSLHSECNKQNSRNYRQYGFAAAVACMVGLTGCATSTTPLTEQERLDRSATDLERLFGDHVAVKADLTLHEAMARAVKFNMDHRLKLMELAVASRQYDLSKAEMLPQITASAGYTNRSNDPGARSISVESGEESLEPSTSQERKRDLQDLEVSWNVLDFGLSYHTAKQSSDEVKIAEERRRKVIQNIMQDVVDAYWKAFTAQQIEQEMGALIAETGQAIEQSKSLVASKSQSKKEALKYQRGLMETRSNLWEMRERMGLAHTRLGALIHAKPGEQFTLAAPDANDMPGELKFSLSDMEGKALVNRPELREEDYRLRISNLDVKKAMLRIFPGFEVFAGVHADSNKFLINDSWETVGATLSWNLFNVIGAMKEKDFRKAQVELADARRLALSMAVLTQVHLSAKRYGLARQRFLAASELSAVNGDYYEMVQGSGDAESEFERIRAKSVALASKMRKHLAYAETQAALGRVMNTLGFDPLPGTVESHDLGAISNAIASHQTNLKRVMLN